MGDDGLFGSDESEEELEFVEDAQAVPDAAAPKPKEKPKEQMQDLFGDSDGESDGGKEKDEEIEFDDVGGEIRGASVSRNANRAKKSKVVSRLTAS